MNSLKEVWQAITEYLKDRINIVTYDTWLAGLEIVDITGNEATLRIKSEFHKKIIIENYEDLLKEAFLDVMKFHVNVKIITADEAFVAPQMPIKAPHYEYTFETFIVGSSNRFAHAAALAVAETPEIIYNPLYIYGNPGLGKTHLLNAIRSRINEKFPDRVVISLSCEAFVNEFIYSLNMELSISSVKNTEMQIIYLLTIFNLFPVRNQQKLNSSTPLIHFLQITSR